MSRGKRKRHAEKLARRAASKSKQVRPFARAIKTFEKIAEALKLPAAERRHALDLIEPYKSRGKGRGNAWQRSCMGRQMRDFSKYPRKLSVGKSLIERAKRTIREKVAAAS